MAIWASGFVVGAAKLRLVVEADAIHAFNVAAVSEFVAPQFVAQIFSEPMRSRIPSPLTSRKRTLRFWTMPEYKTVASAIGRVAKRLKMRSWPSQNGNGRLTQRELCVSSRHPASAVDQKNDETVRRSESDGIVIDSSSVSNLVSVRRPMTRLPQVEVGLPT
mgnify:CR=1 FL=1